jgi:hypothetical protein
MLVTKYFVFLHLPKTGGSFVAEVCHRHLPRGWVVPNDLDPHAPYEEAKARYSGLPMLAFVRNPWDWYVSWYHYLLENPPPEPHTPELTPMWVAAFDRGRSDFKTVVTRACTGETFGNVATAEVMRERGIDHYSALYRMKVATGIEEGKVEAGRFEALREDFLAFLERHSVPVGHYFAEVVRRRARVRASRHDHYRAYYDDELRELVGRSAREIVERYGYSF